MNAVWVWSQAVCSVMKDGDRAGEVVDGVRGVFKEVRSEVKDERSSLLLTLRPLLVSGLRGELEGGAQEEAWLRRVEAGGGRRFVGGVGGEIVRELV